MLSVREGLGTGAAVAAIAIGAMDLAGWTYGVSEFVTVLPGYPAMVPQTALSLILSGLALLVLPRIGCVAAALGLAVAGLAAAVLVEYVAAVDLGIDHRLLADRATVPAPFPGRMGPNTATCLLLLGTAILFLALPRWRPQAWFATAAAFAVATVGMLALLSHASAVLDRHFMAIHTAASLLALSLAILLPKRDDTGAIRWATAAMVIGTLASLLLWQVVLTRQWSHVTELTAAYLKTARYETALQAQASVQALARMAARWAMRRDAPEAEWQADAQSYLAQLPGLHAVGWVDSNRRLRRVALVGGRPALDAGLLDYGRQPELFPVVPPTGRPAVSRTVDIGAGKRGFFILAPIARGGDPDGTLLGLFDVDGFFGALSFVAGSRVRYGVFDGGKEIHAGGDDGPAVETFALDAVLDALGPNWRIHMAPTTRFVAEQTAGQPETALLAGLAMTVLLVLSTRLGQVLRDRNRGLVAAMAAREQAERILANKVDELAESNKALDDFAHVASHDLKEPLRGIHNYTSMLLEDCGSILPEDARQKLARIGHLSQRLDTLVNDLLSYSRLGRTDMSVKPVDLNDVMADVLEQLHPFLETSHAVVQVVSPLPSISCDTVRVGEVFRNLITNAVKYNESAERRIEVGCLPPSDAGPVLFVRDNGIGIPERFQERIFEIFKRLHGRDKYGGGTGAGLAIVRKIVEQHGGRVWLQSEVGHGSTFFFTLQGRDSGNDRRGDADFDGGG